jgi:hypothetical protein
MPSATYNENIYKKVGRITEAEVIYSLTAVGSKEGGSLDLPPGNEFSRPEQIMNEIRSMSAPIATLEPDYWLLDGSFVLPVPPEQSDMEVGWWSGIRSEPVITGWNYKLGSWRLGENPFAKMEEYGVFPEPFVIERVFDVVQTFNAFGITFDTQTNNYCTEFEVEFYDFAGTMVYREYVTDNSEPYWRSQHPGRNILRIVIKLYKTNRWGRYARITEIDFGILLEYRGEVIRRLNLIREADITGRSYPLPELQLNVLNQGLYDRLDSNTYAPYIQPHQRFDYRHGLVLPDGTTEWIECGAYYLKNWKVSDKVVEFVCTGLTSLMEESTFFDSSFQRVTVSEFIKAHYLQSNVDIMSPMFMPFFGNIDYRRLITMLTELSCCLVYEDKDNIIMFDDIVAKEMPIGDWDWNYQLGDWRLGEKSFGTRILSDISYHNIIGTPKDNQREAYNAINLIEYTMSTEYRQVSKTEHSPGDITIYFDAPVLGDVDVELPAGYQLINRIVRTMYMTGTLIGSNPVEIIVNGERVEFAKSEITYRAPWHTGFENDIPYKIDLPCMIRGEGFEAFRDWFLGRRFKILHMLIEVDVHWMQNPAFELGDIRNVQLRDTRSNADMFVTRLEYDFPALQGNTQLISHIEMR